MVKAMDVLRIKARERSVQACKRAEKDQGKAPSAKTDNGSRMHCLRT